MASFLDGLVDADPLAVALVIGAVVVCAGAYVFLRVRARRRSGG